jgi:hypothetical protein
MLISTSPLGLVDDTSTIETRTNRELIVSSSRISSARKSLESLACRFPDQIILEERRETKFEEFRVGAA